MFQLKNNKDAFYNTGKLTRFFFFFKYGVNLAKECACCYPLAV